MFAHYVLYQDKNLRYHEKRILKADKGGVCFEDNRTENQSNHKPSGF